MSMKNDNRGELCLVGVVMVGLTVAVIVKAIDATTYAALVGATVGYAFGRIFNHSQGRE